MSSEVDRDAGSTSATPEAGPSSSALEENLLHGDTDDQPAADEATPPEKQLVEMDVDEDIEEKVGNRPASIMETPLYLSAFHIFKSNVGVGIFLLPMIYNDMGYIMSPLVAFPIGLLIIDCMVMLLTAKQGIRRTTVQSYPEVAEFIFGSLMRVVVNGALTMAQFGFCLIYLQAAATILSDIFDFHESYKAFVAIELVIVMPFTFLTHNLKLLALASATATFLVWFTIVGTAIHFGEQLEEHGSSSTISAAGKVAKWPLFVCSNITVLEGIGVVLPVENATAAKDKPRVKTMIRTTMLCIIVAYALYASFGYAAYGCNLTNTSVTVLPKTAFGNIVRCGLAINLLLTYPIQFVPAIQIIDRALGIPAERTGGKSKKAALTRVCISVLLAMLAMLVGGDTVELVTSFIGATAAVFLAIILPSMIGLHTEHAVTHDSTPRKGKEYFKAMLTLQPRPLHRAKCFVYFTIGVIVFVIGTTVCLIDTASIVNRKSHRSGHGNSTATGVTCGD